MKAELVVKIDSENEEIVLNGSHFVEACKAYSGTLTRREIVRVNASLGELREN